MFDRGNCSYTQKVKHAQDVGVRAVVIANNIPNQDVEELIMRDSGVGGTLNIPALMISKEDADSLKQVYKQESIEVLLGFELPRSKEKISLSLILSSGDTESQRFITEFYEIGKFLNSGNVELEVHFVVIECLACKKKGFAKYEDNCMGGGRYCAPDPDDKVSGPLTGRDVIQEDLMQMCLLDLLKSEKSFNSYSRYFEFQLEFGLNCRDKLNDKSCSEAIIKKLQFNVDKLKDCINKSFESGDRLLATNRKLEKEVEYWRMNGLHLYPTLIINHQIYKGNMENSVIKNAICGSYYRKNSPGFCGYPVFDEDGRVDEGYSTFTVVFGLFLFFGILGAVLFVYRHMAKKELQKEMRQQVNAAVNQYFALNDLSSSKQSERQVVKSSYV